MQFQLELLKQKDSICARMQQMSQNKALLATKLKIVHIQVNKPVTSSENKFTWSLKTSN